MDFNIVFYRPASGPAVSVAIFKLGDKIKVMGDILKIEKVYGYSMQTIRPFFAGIKFALENDPLRFPSR